MGDKDKPRVTRPGGEPYGFDDICSGDESLHKELFLRGVKPKMAEMGGWEFRGRNLSFIPRLIAVRKFIKGFLAPAMESGDPDEIDGYNLWPKRAGRLDGTWEPVEFNGKSVRHGFFKVHPVLPDHVDNKYPHALLIDYSLAKNPWIHPAREMRDYLVQVYPDNPDLLFGKAYMPLGDLRIFGTYFVMERYNQPEPR